MLKAEQVPDEVAWKLHDRLWKVGGPSVDEVREAIAAAINAWPGMMFNDAEVIDGDLYPPIVYLTIRQEPRDE